MINQLVKKIVAVLGITCIMIAWVAFAQFKHDSRSNDGMLQVAINPSINQLEVCTKTPDEELNKLPIHMRQKVKCKKSIFPYQLEILINQEIKIKKNNINSNNVISLMPGNYQVSVSLTPLDNNNPQLKSIQLSQTIQIQANQITKLQVP